MFHLPLPRARPGDLEAVARAFPFSPWDYHALDYI